jgi:glycosyltransferase involved in cell wall biosynthesis
MTTSIDIEAVSDPYVLITAAYNEGDYIGDTIEAVVSQTVRPIRWVIVSDGSVDCTDDVVQSYAQKHSFIHFLRRERDAAQSFASKVFAVRAGLKCLSGYTYNFIGNLDADITFPPSYFSDLISVFHKNSLLGISGGRLLERVRGEFAPRGFGVLTSVPGAIQMFRRECYEDIGGFIPIEYGGEDWHAEVSARMRGWEVQTVPELLAYHHRTTGGATGKLRYLYRQGFMDYALGCHPVFEAARVLRRIPRAPYVVGAAARWTGFVLAHFKNERVVSSEFMHFLRNEQMRRLLSSH